MRIKYRGKHNRQNYLVATLITVLLIFTVFSAMVGSFYRGAEDEAYENLHMQTKQIKDDMELQLMSDRENLATMAGFAAKLYGDGESYDIMFDSFKPIGLIENIGILNPDNIFVTKAGTLDLNGLISFEKEAKRGEYISGRVADLTRINYDIIRSAVPIKYNGETVGILYGVIKLDVIGRRYSKMAKEINAQLFVYDTKTGNLVVDTSRSESGNIEFLKDREYTEGCSYEEMRESDNGFASFKSAYSDELLYIHYSTLDKVDWKITMGRYESSVFAKTHRISSLITLCFGAMLVIIVLYILFLLYSENQRGKVTTCASRIRKLLLEINQHNSSVNEALRELAVFAQARSAVFFDTDGEDHNQIVPLDKDSRLSGDDRKYFITAVLRYAAEYHEANTSSVGLMCIKTGSQLLKINPGFCEFLQKHNISQFDFASVIDKNNHTSILGVINSENNKGARTLLGDIAVCFSIAFFNKKHLDKTEVAATTDTLTGVANRVLYNKDLQFMDSHRPSDFACIYIDVNELHLINNKYGHAAGDKMLLYIANTLKEVFYGHRIYRMGGDEFLVFAENVKMEDVRKSVEIFKRQLVSENYHVAVGLSYRSRNLNTDEMVREAEIRMYEAKAQYYQDKQKKRVNAANEKEYVQIKTGIAEIDSMISILKENYNGIYRVSLATDKARRILMPAYLGYNETEEHFSKLLTGYIDDSVAPEFHRAVMSFLNYDAIKRQFAEGKIPEISYKKNNGESVVLRVYALDDSENVPDSTLWVFARV